MGTLFIVATPIGNLKDITLRALEVFREVDVIACEDTRHTLKLLNSHEIKKPLMSCNANAEGRSAAKIIGLLNEGKSVAFASDAGTPALSDPGSLLVNEARNAGFAVLPIPGPSASAALFSVAGMRGKGFFFEGFLSPKKGRRRKRIEELVSRKEPFLLYESPFRIVKLMDDLADICPERPVLIGREMTKVYEEYIDGDCKTVFEMLKEREKILGEISLLVGAKKKD
ncbi:MAG: 16S rRNA (cytidine(1402)-2'-O)-methyltransferase [Spirochaetales bacterium]|jgi:16S rRNA (cytidine1402-2'-O)-methyltransferase|nr:16S rRNA (cytidine(1402)-2'-O)-methyltransferase [Spirochaetales bacterium]